MHATVTRAISLIRSLAPELDVRVEGIDAYCLVHLPLPLGAEYGFRLYVYDDGEPQVCARLVDGDPDADFWCWPFEEPDFDSHAEREGAFLDGVRELTSRSRIIQQRGLLTTTFRCQVERHGKWSMIGDAVGYLRWSTKPPPTKRRVTCYRSPALTASC